jgi:hypothetical protein
MIDDDDANNTDSGTEENKKITAMIENNIGQK